MKCVKCGRVEALAGSNYCRNCFPEYLKGFGFIVPDQSPISWPELETDVEAPAAAPEPPENE